MGLRTRVTRKVLLPASFLGILLPPFPERQQVIDVLASASCLLLRRLQLLKSVECCLNYIQNVRTALGLGQDVAHSSHFEHSTNAACSDYASTRRSRLEHHARTGHLAQHFMRNGRALQIDNAHIFASPLRSFAHCIRHSVCLANAHGNGAALVANHHCHTELKTAATFYNFCNTCNFNNALLELILRFVALLFSILVFCHFFLHSSLKLQAAFARAICKSLDASNITITTAVKNNGLNPLVFGPLSNCLTDQFGLFGFLQAFHFFAQIMVHG